MLGSQTRTSAFEDTLFELERQHGLGGRLVEEMDDAIDLCQGGAAGALERLAAVVERFADVQWLHMCLEENVILPAALEELAEEDWARSVPPSPGTATRASVRRPMQAFDGCSCGS